MQGAAAARALLQQRRLLLLRRQSGAEAAGSTPVCAASLSRGLQQLRRPQHISACSIPRRPAYFADEASLAPRRLYSWHPQQFSCHFLPSAFQQTGSRAYASQSCSDSNKQQRDRLPKLNVHCQVRYNEQQPMQRQHAKLLLDKQLQEQQQRRRFEVESRRRGVQQQQLLLPVLLQSSAATLATAAALPAAVLDMILPPLQSALLRTASAAEKERQLAVSGLLQRLSHDLTRLRSSSQKEGRGPSETRAEGSSNSSSSSDAKTSKNSDDSSNSSPDGRDSSSGKSSRSGGTGGGRGARIASASSSPRRVPTGFEHFYPKRRLQDQDPKTSSSSGSSSSSSTGRMPFMPSTGGALQHLLLRMCVWLGFWAFALSLLSRVVEPQLSLQEFLSSYVARGLVEKVVVVGDKGRCNAVVRAAPTPQQLQEMQLQQQQQLLFMMQQQQQQQAMQMQYQQQQPDLQQQPQQQQQAYGPSQPQVMPQQPLLMQQQPLLLQQQQQPKLSDMLPRKHIVRFKTGLTPESFIEKMEHFQSSLGIHPKDFLPIYVEEGWTFNLGEFIASAFFFLIMATIARDLFLAGAMNRGGSTSGLNRLLGNSSSKRARIKADTVSLSTRFLSAANCLSFYSGLHEAKREIMEFVAFLKNPGAFQKMGAKLPRGALLVGPPGTGKTLLAKAVAGEAGVPFFSISGSDFVELFVGVGASRVRELFDEARKAAPSIIWIDEIDSVGASRSSQFANSEREQTLNQLLVEMDGFSPHQSVVVLAGTNREDLLDAALKRAGRFDRRVQIGRPDVKERSEIFKVHLKPLKLSSQIDPEALAERMAALTPGMVGADIANVCNEAAIYAARRRTKRGIEQRDFEMAIERIIAGLPSNTKTLMSTKQRMTIAFHEAGHAVAGWFLKHADVVLKLTIIPRDSGAMGFSQQMPPPVELYEKDALLDKIAVCLAGRAAEELFMGCISSGAIDDIEKATHLARLIVMQLGMNDKVGLVNLRKNQQTMQEPYPPFSDATAKLVDDEVRALITQQYERVKALLSEKEQELRSLCSMLLEKESLTFADLQDCLGLRPYPPDAQLAAYINALPTRALPSPDGIVDGTSAEDGEAGDPKKGGQQSGGHDSGRSGGQVSSSQDKLHKPPQDENGKDDSDKDDDQGPSGGSAKSTQLPPSPLELDFVSAESEVAETEEEASPFKHSLQQQQEDGTSRAASYALAAADTFGSLGVCQSLCAVLQHLSLVEPTPVQLASLPLGLLGRDFCAIAPTGTGKTLCYLLPVLQRLHTGLAHTFMCVVLLPARELVAQVGEQFGIYGQHLGLRWVEVTGGRDMMTEATALQQQAPHVVLATPGRLADLLQRERGLAAAEQEAASDQSDSEESTSGGKTEKAATKRALKGPIHERLQAVDCLVLDEADRLLSEEFGPDLSLLLSSLPTVASGRQTLLLSASCSDALLQLQQEFGDAKMPLLQPEAAAKCPPLLQHRYVFVPAAMRGVYVLHLLQQEPFASQRGIVFAGSVRRTQQLATALQELGVECVALHSLLRQQQRVAALSAFRSQHKQLLVATDVAARGLDLPNLEFVVNLQPPKEPEVYVHRVGRTARAGRKGVAITFVDPADVPALHRVEAYIGKRLEEQPMSSLGLSKIVRQMLGAEAQATDRLRVSGFEEKAAIYEAAQREYRRLRQEKRLRG
ncbi:hypothetical protein Efla_002665 [Eimeria flavescens]